MASAQAAVTATTAGASQTSDGAPAFGARSAVAYAPMPRNAAWPNDTRPVSPTRSASDSAKIADTMIVVARSIAKRPPNNGNATTAIAAAMTGHAARASGAVLDTAKQALGAPQQDRRHQHVDGDAGRLGHEHLAERVDEADQERREERASHRADAADEDADERQDQRRVAHPGIHRRRGRGDHPGERRQRDAGREHDAVEEADVD